LAQIDFVCNMFLRCVITNAESFRCSGQDKSHETCFDLHVINVSLVTIGSKDFLVSSVQVFHYA